MECYDFDVIHIKGTRNSVADALSRAEHLKYRPEENLDPFEERDEVQTLNSVGLGVNVLQGESFTPRMFRETQEEDEVLRVIRRLLRTGEKPSREMVDVASPGLKTYFGLLDSLYLDDKDVLRYKYPYVEQPGAEPKEKHLLVLPEDLAYDILKMVHEKGAHMAVEATTRRAMQMVYSHHLMDLARTVVKRCVACQKARKKPKDQRHTLYVPRQGFAFQRCTVDFVGPLCKAEGTGARYILTVQDSLTRWTEGFAVRSCTARTVVDVLQREILSRYGQIQSIHSDRGTHFTANYVRDACKILNIPWTFTVAMNPKASRVESAHKIIGRMLTALTQGRQEKWQSYLGAALFALRTSMNRHTGFSPYRLLFGREAMTDLELMFGKPNQPSEFKDYDDYAVKLRDRIQQATRWAQENIGGAVRRQRRAYCQAKKVYVPGQRVWLFTPRRKIGESGKYKVLWTGPYTVTRAINDLTYELAPHPSWPRQSHEVVSIDRLAPYYSDNEEGGETDAEVYAPSPTDDLSMEGDEHAEHVEFPTVAGNGDDDDDDDEYNFDPDPAFVPLPPDLPEPLAPPDLGGQDAVEGEQVLGLPRAAHEAAAENRREEPLLRAARFQPPLGGERDGAGAERRAERPGTPAPGRPTHPEFGSGSPAFFTPGASPSPRASAERRAANWRRKTFGEGMGASPPLPRVAEEGREGATATADVAFSPPSPSPSKKARLFDSKRGKPLAEREAEYRKKKEEEEGKKQAMADERSRRREERIRKREEQEKKKQLGRRYGFEPDTGPE